MKLTVDGRPVEYEEGDSALLALLRANLHPTGGGCLCLAGDCPHCLATVDGVAYVRTCQEAARSDMRIERAHLGGELPPLLRASAQTNREVGVRHQWCDVVVIGAGGSGTAAAEEARAAGREVVTLDAAAGEEVVGFYPGPLVVARAREGMRHVHPREEVVVATGASEIQPVAPGNDLAGLVTARALPKLAKAGLDLGRVVAVGTAPEGVEAVRAAGQLVRFEGDGSVSAVVVRDAAGREQRLECDTVSLGLGQHPRDALFRMGRDLGPVRAVGAAAAPADVPPCPAVGTVCPCSNVAVDDLDDAWRRGFQELELLKRASLAGIGTCQGATCLPYLRSFVADRGTELQPPFTARPVTRQPTFAEIAAGAHHRATPRTPLDAEHRRLGAHMERSGGWWRPWSYGRPAAEYRAAREAVSLGDVSTLGKMQVSGPDALALLEHLYPVKIAALKPGRCRYVLMLDERGYVFDDGLVCREDESRFLLTFTSAGSTLAELWVRDWAESLDLDVRLLNQTMSLGAINVTGPRAAELLARACAEELPGFMRHGVRTVAGVRCRVFRLSFTGELSYELHHDAVDSVALWRRLLRLGQDLGIEPHGLETLLGLRLEKGHIVVGQDTDYDSTLRRIDHGWALHRDKAEFIGRQAVLRTDQVALDRQLVGLEMESPAPIEGAVVWCDGEYGGYVTSSTDSPRLGKAVMLAWVWLVDGTLPAQVTVDGRTARRVPTPFYDPEGARARATVPVEAGEPRSFGSAPQPETSRFEQVDATRIVADPTALDALQRESGAGQALRFAPDELWVDSRVDRGAVRDPHALVVRETGFARAWLSADQARAFLARECEWRLPETRPAFAQGAVAGIPVKLWLEEDRTAVLVPTALTRSLEARLG